MLGFASKLVKTITFKKVLILTLAGVLSVLAVTSYENRADLFSSTGFGKSLGVSNPVGTTFTIGDLTKRKVKKIVDDDSSIQGIVILASDIRMNSRTSMFSYEKNEGMTTEKFTQARKPLFTKNEENNRQIVKLLNGEFTCGPHKQTILSQPLQSIEIKSVFVCRASLPPYYGHFAGFITVFLNIDPDIEKQVQLKSDIEALATEIYFRDVIPTVRKLKIES